MKKKKLKFLKNFENFKLKLKNRKKCLEALELKHDSEPKMRKNIICHIYPLQLESGRSQKSWNYSKIIKN